MITIAMQPLAKEKSAVQVVIWGAIWYPSAGAPHGGALLLYYMLYVVMDIGFNLKRVISQDHKCCKYPAFDWVCSTMAMANCNTARIFF